MKKHILITGACGSLGQALLHKLAAADVRITAIDKNKNESLEKEFPQVAFHYFDLNEHKAMREFIGQLKENNALPNTIIFNAAVHIRDNDPFIDFDKFHQAMQSNALSILFFLSEFMPQQKEPTLFLLCSSGVIIFPNPEYLGYYLSKLTATKTFDVFDDRYRSSGFRFKTIVFGPIQSPMLENSRPPTGLVNILRNLTSCRPHEAAEMTVRLMDSGRKRLYYPRSSAAILWASRILQALLPKGAKFYRV